MTILWQFRYDGRFIFAYKDIPGNVFYELCLKLGKRQWRIFGLQFFIYDSIIPVIYAYIG